MNKLAEDWEAWLESLEASATSQHSNPNTLADVYHVQLDSAGSLGIVIGCGHKPAKLLSCEAWRRKRQGIVDTEFLELTVESLPIFCCEFACVRLPVI